MEELKPCPFCGGESEMTRETHIETELQKTETAEFVRVTKPRINDGWLCECKKCGARGPHEYNKDPIQSRIEATTAWNTRKGENNA